MFGQKLKEPTKTKTKKNKNGKKILTKTTVKSQGVTKIPMCAMGTKKVEKRKKARSNRTRSKRTTVKGMLTKLRLEVVELVWLGSAGCGLAWLVLACFLCHAVRWTLRTATTLKVGAYTRPALWAPWVKHLTAVFAMEIRLQCWAMRLLMLRPTVKCRRWG